MVDWVGEDSVSGVKVMCEDVRDDDVDVMCEDVRDDEV